MHLNVLFDQQLEAPIKARTVTFELRDVTAGEALEMILRTNNLIYTQVGRRTIAIASDQVQNRARFEQMAVRTFYVKNADPADVRTAITSTLGTKQITIAKQVNALIVRDSPSNLDLIAGIIDSIDKSKADPILGRFFSTPMTTNQQNDVVITVTAHILRHADIRDGDQLAKEAGRGSDAARLPTIEEILYRADQEDAREERSVRAKERAAAKN
jgi:type II secretory pathway component GspD/PulD (secretin)